MREPGAAVGFGCKMLTERLSTEKGRQVAAISLLDVATLATNGCGSGYWRERRAPPNTAILSATSDNNGDAVAEARDNENVRRQNHPFTSGCLHLSHSPRLPWRTLREMLKTDPSGKPVFAA